MAALATQAVYNAQRAAGDILAAYSSDMASITIHLNDGSFRFGRQPGIFTFDSPAAAFLDCIRAQRVPAGLLDVFSEANVPLHDGCLIVEVHDHRRVSLPASRSGGAADHPTSSNGSSGSGLASGSSSGLAANGTSSSSELSSNLLQQLARSSRTYLTNHSRWPFYGNAAQRSTERSLRGSASDVRDEHLAEIYRIVLFPTAETLWQGLKDLDAELGSVWTDEDAFCVEAGVLTAITPPLCLTPDPHVTRIANTVQAATTAPPPATRTSPEHPRGIKRGRGGLNSSEAEEVAAQKRRRRLVMRIMEKGDVGQVPLRDAQANGGEDGPARRASVSSDDSDALLVDTTAPAATPAVPVPGVFEPTFRRFSLIDRIRDAKTGGTQPEGRSASRGATPAASEPSPSEPSTPGGRNVPAPPSSTAASTSKKNTNTGTKATKSKAKKRGSGAMSPPPDAATPAASTTSAPPAKPKKKTKKQRMQEEKEAREKEAREAKEREETEAKERAAKEAKAKVDAEASSKPTKGKKKSSTGVAQRGKKSSASAKSGSPAAGSPSAAADDEEDDSSKKKKPTPRKSSKAAKGASPPPAAGMGAVPGMPANPQAPMMQNRAGPSAPVAGMHMGANAQAQSMFPFGAQVPPAQAPNAGVGSPLAGHQAAAAAAAAGGMQMPIPGMPGVPAGMQQAGRLPNGMPNMPNMHNMEAIKAMMSRMTAGNPAMSGMPNAPGAARPGGATPNMAAMGMPNMGFSAAGNNAMRGMNPGTAPGMNIPPQQAGQMQGMMPPNLNQQQQQQIMLLLAQQRMMQQGIQPQQQNQQQQQGAQAQQQQGQQAAQALPQDQQQQQQNSQQQTPQPSRLPQSQAQPQQQQAQGNAQQQAGLTQQQQQLAALLGGAAGQNSQQVALLQAFLAQQRAAPNATPTMPMGGSASGLSNANAGATGAPGGTSNMPNGQLPAGFPLMAHMGQPTPQRFPMAPGAAAPGMGQQQGNVFQPDTSSFNSLMNSLYQSQQQGQNQQSG